jgi:hypothetical protein
MRIVGAFDVHRRQLTFEYLDTVTGELRRGRVVPADRQHLRKWLARFVGHDDVHFALEGCTGWRYVAEELLAAGIEPHLAEPADTAALRGRKRHAKTDPLTDHLGVFSQLAGRVVMGVATVAGHERRRGWPTRSGPAGGAALRVA